MKVKIVILLVILCIGGLDVVGAPPPPRRASSPPPPPPPRPSVRPNTGNRLNITRTGQRANIAPQSQYQKLPVRAAPRGYVRGQVTNLQGATYVPAKSGYNYPTFENVNLPPRSKNDFLRAESNPRFAPNIQKRQATASQRMQAYKLRAEWARQGGVGQPPPNWRGKSQGGYGAVPVAGSGSSSSGSSLQSSAAPSQVGAYSGFSGGALSGPPGQYESLGGSSSSAGSVAPSANRFGGSGVAPATATTTTTRPPASGSSSASTSSGRGSLPTSVPASTRAPRSGAIGSGASAGGAAAGGSGGTISTTARANAGVPPPAVSTSAAGGGPYVSMTSPANAGGGYVSMTSSRPVGAAPPPPPPSASAGAAPANPSPAVVSSSGVRQRVRAFLRSRNAASPAGGQPPVIGFTPDVTTSGRD